MVSTLPPADWTRREDLRALIDSLSKGESSDNVRYVGGAVRDTLLGLEVRDIDLATPLVPTDVIARLDAAGIRNVPTGIDHGTVTAVLPGGPVEITTLRQDVSTDGRRATVAFATRWQDDAARRDFTINALYADPDTLELFDYFDGLQDLADRRVRFIGDARQRIREDHLRILRYFRFQARFGAQPADRESEKSCSELAAMLKGLSRERVGKEMMTLLGLPDPSTTVTRMAELGVLEKILAEADPKSLTTLVAEERKQGIGPEAIRRLAALLPADQNLAEQVAARFRLSGAQKKRLSTAAVAKRITDPGNPRAMAYRLGRDQALDRLLLMGKDATALKDWDIPTFPLKGGAIVEKGIKAGPEVARILRAVEDRWIEEGFPDSDRVQAILAQAL